MQQINYALTDFYGDWILIELKLKKCIAGNMITNLCDKLLEAFNNRKKDLINNKAMLCAVFLDPRFKFNLTSDQDALVKILLVDMWTEIKNLKQRESLNGLVPTENPSASGDEDDDLLEKKFVEKSAQVGGNCSELERNSGVATKSFSPGYTKSKIEFLSSIEEYEKGTSRLHHSASIFNFWENSKSKYAEIYVVARVYFGIPPAQATVERTFSVVGFIYNNRRFNLSKFSKEN